MDDETQVDDVPSEGRRETERQRQRRERAERRAARLHRDAEQHYAAARAEIDPIPPGQPILVGHHSERAHRRAIERHDAKMRRGVEAARDAQTAEWTARGAGRAILSDDPEALHALRARLADLEAARELRKAINRAYRKGGFAAVARVPGVMPAMLAKAQRTMELAPWMAAPMDVQNLGANIRRIRTRIAELESAAVRAPAAPVVGEGFTIEEDPDDHRIRFRFEKRPEREVIAAMKRAGFRWSRQHGAWQRALNDNGRCAARRVAAELFGWGGEESS
ncbi:MAG: DUF3560 domain-containing protein [Sandaracinaceae bacterium]